MNLGDEAIPYGLWKSIELMRRGEKSLIMVKPKWGYGKPEVQGLLTYPQGWDTPEKRETLAKRRTFFEVTLLDWSVKHDLDGDRMIIKTIFDKGVGYDRPFDFDEFTIDLKIYQKLADDAPDTVLLHNPDLTSDMTDTTNITPLIKKILQTMKTEERVSCKVSPAYYCATEKSGLVERYKDSLDLSKDLYVDIHMKQLTKVEDIYKDGGSTLHKTLKKGHGTASPYSDF